MNSLIYELDIRIQYSMYSYCEERHWGFGDFWFCLKEFYEANQSLCNSHIGRVKALEGFCAV